MFVRAAEDHGMQDVADSTGIRHRFVYFKVKKLTVSPSRVVCDAAFVDTQHTALLLVCYIVT